MSENTVQEANEDIPVVFAGDVIPVSEDIIPNSQFVINELDYSMTIADEGDYWSDYFANLENQYVDMLVDDEETELEDEHISSESEDDMSTPIFPGSMTTLGMSLYSILVYAIKHSLR